MNTEHRRLGQLAVLVALAIGAARGADDASATAAGALSSITRPPGPFVFIHIPKTAGSTITRVFDDIYSRELGCARHPLASTDADVPPLPGPNARCVWAHARAGVGRDDRAFFGRAALGNSDNGGGPSPTAASANAADVRLDMLIGHVPFGTCHLTRIQDPPPNAAPRTTCRYITVFREPLSRLLSHYTYLQRAVPEYVALHCPTCTTVDGFAVALANNSLGPLYIDNPATRMLAGDGFLATLSRNRVADQSGSVDRAMLALAKHNLAHHFALVGFTEDLPAFISAFRMLVGAAGDGASTAAASPQGAAASGGQRAAAALPVENANPGARMTSEALSDETRALLLRSQAFDVQLYHFARRLVKRKGPLLDGR